MKEKRAYTASVIFKNKLYVAGGSRGLYDELQDPYSIRPFEELEYSNSVEVYDLATNTWEPWIIDNVPPRYGVRRPPHELSNYRANMCVTASIASNKIFFAGGSTGGFFQFTNPTLVDDTIDIYDVGTNTWTVRRMSAPRSHCTAEYMSNGKVYIVGGLTTDMNSDAVDIYDIATDSFDYTVISQARQGIVSAVLKDDTSGVETLMLIGGTTFGGKNRWLYEGQSKHSQRIDFFNGTHWDSDNVPQGHSEHAGAAYKDIIYVAGGVDNIHRFVSRAERIERAVDCLDYKCFKRTKYGQAEFFRPPCPSGTVRHPRTGVCDPARL